MPADAAPLIIDHRPTACEGLDRRIVDVVRRTRGDAAVPPLPRGDGWMFVELVGDDAGRAARYARMRCWLRPEPRTASWSTDPAAGPGAVEDPRRRCRPGEHQSGPTGLSRLGGRRGAAASTSAAYLRDFDRLLADHGLDGLPYGHFGDGCVHVRIDFPLTEQGGAGAYRAFVEQAAQLVAGYGGSMSGEHGDGRARSALLPAMYSAAAMSSSARSRLPSTRRTC